MSIQAKEEMYMNIAVTDDTEDERLTIQSQG